MKLNFELRYFSFSFFNKSGPESSIETSFSFVCGETNHRLCVHYFNKCSGKICLPGTIASRRSNAR